MHLRSMSCVVLCSLMLSCSNNPTSKNNTEIKQQASIDKAHAEANKAKAHSKAKADTHKIAIRKAAALKAQEQVRRNAKVNADKLAAQVLRDTLTAKANAKKSIIRQHTPVSHNSLDSGIIKAHVEANKAKADAHKIAIRKATALKAQEQARRNAKVNADKLAAQALRDTLTAKANAKKSIIRQHTPVSHNSLDSGIINVSKSEAASLLGTQYTPMGAIKEGNADGSIPAWTGNMLGAPANIDHKPQAPHIDPYASEKPLYIIHAGNVSKYSAHLSEGQKALFGKYPDTFVMPIYPSHRDGRYNKKIESRTAWNAAKTKLVNGLDGLNDYTGGAPFPFPQNAAEVLWNARIIHPHQSIVGHLDDVAVYPNGNIQLRRQNLIMDFPFAHSDNLVGQVDEQISVNAALVHIILEEPKRQKGQMTIIHEALDQVKNERKAWVYLTGPRRVRRAPMVGFDTPDGPGGLVTVDDALGFNGAMVRFSWKLIGKKEIYIPYHNYKFDSPHISYDTLLNKGHANPDYMRYEKHRVWVVEANLNEGSRHVYAKRRFYIDEDSWHLAIVESYDGRGDLWRVGLLNSIYDFSVEGFIARAQLFHDLQSGAYVANRLINKTAVPDYNATPKGEHYYSPSNLKKLGR